MFDRIKALVDHNKSQEYNCIPFRFQRFAKYIHGIEKNKYYLVTANSGVGKSQITDDLFWYTPFEFVMNNPQTNIKVKFFYYSLEMDAESKYLQAAARYLFREQKIRTSVNVLKSISSKIGDSLYNSFLTSQDYVDKLASITTMVEEVNPYGIYKQVATWMEENGTSVTKQVTIGGENKNVFSHYVPNDPDLYVIVIVDHLDELTIENNKSQKETIQTHTKYMKNLRNKYGVTIVDIQQQSASQEGVDNFKLNKLEPSLNGLGEDKTSQRRYNIAFGLFSPYRHEILNYKNYNIGKLKDNFRQLSVLKNRNGMVNVSVPLLFDGAVNFFQELPKSDDTLALNKIYSYIDKLHPI